MLATIMDGLSTLLSGIAANAYAWPAESVSVPCTIIGYPTSVTFDLVFGRGGDTFVFPIWHLVGRSSDKSSRDALSTALTGAGSVKEALDGGQTFGAVRVTDAELEEVTIAAVTYVGVRYTVEVLT